MENYLIRRKKLLHLLERNNFEMLKDSEKRAIKSYLSKNQTLFVIYSLSSAISLLLLKKFIFKSIRNNLFSSVIEFSFIFSLSSSSKIFIEKTTHNDLKGLDKILNDNTYLVKNSILLSRNGKINIEDNPYISKSSLYIFNLQNYTKANLIFLCLIRLMV